MDDQMTVRVNADTSALERSLRQMELDADRFASTLTQGLKSAVVSGNSLEDVLRSVGKQMASNALSIGLKPFENFLGSAISGVFGGLLPFAKGGTPGLGSGVVSSPTVFGMGSQLGVMGEAGAEAILPLRRDASGRLGVGGTGSGGAVTVNVSINTPDAGSFRKSESQIAAMMARAVSRGSRNN